MKVVLSDLAYGDILDFVQNYQTFLTKNFYDTGLPVEDSIRENYIEQGVQLGQEIYSHVIEKMSQEILAYEILDYGYLTVIRLDTRLIFVSYGEQIEERTIVKIQIFHK